MILRPRNDWGDAARDFRTINSVNLSVLAHKSLFLLQFFLVYQAGNPSLNPLHELLNTLLNDELIVSSERGNVSGAILPILSGYIPHKGEQQ